MNNLVFALDIGTRSVTGIILTKQGEKFSVVDYCMVEHKERSMLDGQIHHVVAVSEVIREVKETLEGKHGKLPRVCVAAAGRALKTVQATASVNLNQLPITDKETIKHLELSAVQTAQRNLAKQENENNYAHLYCAGYSVLYYKLDDTYIGSLIDQSGEMATVEIIATFLPKVVVESLLAALERAGLEMEALTLEPIAAIHVLIPESMRRLNVALVDIGAGTSDIALTDKGTVAAYGMVPVAGDEITEAISDHYLLDFPKAEQAKRKIVDEGKAMVDDILGFETVITYQTLVDDIAETIDKLAQSIRDQIIALNAKPPKAVMLVGGGSLTPEITSILAEKLNLPVNRVAVRGIDAIQQLNQTDRLPAGPDFVTPIGIAIAAKQNPVHYATVKVNERIVRMFEMKQLTIGDCLVQAGIEINKLYGKPGMAFFVKVNNRDITLPGEFGKSPEILLNNKAATVETIVQNGDAISIEKGEDGKIPSITLKELVGEIPSFTIYLNERAYTLDTIFYVNQNLQTKEYIVQDKDEIVFHQPKTVEEFLAMISTEKLQSLKPFTVYVNKKKIDLDKGETQIYLNDKKTTVKQPLKAGDRLVVMGAQDPAVKDMLKQLNKEYWQTIRIMFNGKPVIVKNQCLDVSRNRLAVTEGTILKAGDEVVIKEKHHGPFIFQDVFRYVDLDISKICGKFQLHKNKHPAQFYEVIEDGDMLELTWDGEKR